MTDDLGLPTYEVKVVHIMSKVEVDAPTIAIINTTSRASTVWEKQLSPFFLGPVDLYDNFQSKNVENAWQFSKVYKEHVDKNGNPTNKYWEWAMEGWNDSFAHRYPMGKGALPLYSLWKGEKLGYIEARKRIYAPLYAKALQKTGSWKNLISIKAVSSKMILKDFDGYDHVKLGLSLTDVLNNPNRKMGHAFVIAALLTNDESMQQWTMI